MKDWTTAIIDDLRGMKDGGVEFEEAWRIASKRHRPRGRDRGGVPGETLFDAARPEAQTISEFLYRVCFDAWHGLKPELRKCHVLAEGDVFPQPDPPDHHPAAVGKYRTAA